MTMRFEMLPRRAGHEGLMIAGRALTRTSPGLRWAAGKCLDGAAWCAAFAWRRLPPRRV